METIRLTPTSVPVHPETKPLFDGLVDAVKKLSVPSKGGEVFREILTRIETSSNKEKIVQLENAFSKYDELSLELHKPNLLNGHLANHAEQFVIIEKNIESIKKSIKTEVDLLSKVNNYVARSSDLLITSASDPSHKLTTEQKQEKLRSLELFSSTTLLVGRSSQATTTTSMQQPQRSKIVLDANGAQYTRLREGGGGYCGDMAVSQVTNTPYDISVSRKRLGEIRDAQNIFAPKLEEKSNTGIRRTNSISDHSPLDRFNALKKVIPDFAICKNYALSYVQSNLKVEDFRDKSNLQINERIFNSSQNYDELWRSFEVYSQTLESPAEIQKAFNAFFVNSLPAGFEISEDLDVPGTYLIEGELQALMLDQGYIFSHNILPQDGTHAVQGAFTVLVFTRLIDGMEKYIACDSRPLAQNNMGRQSVGGHYIPVVPVENRMR